MNGLGLGIAGSGLFSGTVGRRADVGGAYPSATFNSPRLSGNGTVGTVTAALLSPGEWPAPLNGDPRTIGTLQTGPLTITSKFAVDLVPAGTSDQVRVTGPVSVGGTLEATMPRGAVSSGQSFTIISNDGSDAVNGTFAVLAEGPRSRSAQPCSVLRMWAATATASC